MGSPDSWIDPEEVSELVGEIFPNKKRAELGEEGYVPIPLLDDDDLVAAGDAVAGATGDDFGQGTAERIGERLRAIRKRAERSGLLVGSERDDEPAAAVPPRSPAEVPELAEPFALPGGRLVEQVSALVDWLAGDFERVFILDELGDELVSGEVPAGLRSGAVRLAQSWERSQRWLREDGQAAEAPVAGAALGGGKVLSVVGARSAGGFYCAALVGDQMVSAEYAARVREALFLVFS